MISKVYVFANGMVMVFDMRGEQIPEYQGRHEDVIGKIRAVYDGPIVAVDWTSHTQE
jgi:hypothetical protein